MISRVSIQSSRVLTIIMIACFSATHRLRPVLLQLVIAPPIISSSTFTTVIRMFVVMCTNCPELAVCLLRQNVADTLVYLLCGQNAASNTANRQIEVSLRLISMIV